MHVIAVCRLLERRDVRYTRNDSMSLRAVDETQIDQWSNSYRYAQLRHFRNAHLGLIGSICAI